MLVYCWTRYSVPLIHMSVFVPIPCGFDYCGFVVLSKVWDGYASCFALKIVLAILGLLWFHMNLRIIFYSSVKNVMNMLIGIVLNLYIALDGMAILTILIPTIQEHEISFYFLELSLIFFINVLQFTYVFHLLSQVLPPRYFTFLLQYLHSLSGSSS